MNFFVNFFYLLTFVSSAIIFSPAAMANEYFGIVNQGFGKLYYFDSLKQEATLVAQVDRAQFKKLEIRENFAVLFTKMGMAQVFGADGKVESEEVFADRVLVNTQLIAFETSSGQVQVYSRKNNQRIFTSPAPLSVGISEQGFATKNLWNGSLDVYDTLGNRLWSRLLSSKDAAVLINNQTLAVQGTKDRVDFYSFDGTLTQSILQATLLNTSDQRVALKVEPQEVRILGEQETGGQGAGGLNFEKSYFQTNQVKFLLNGYLINQNNQMDLYSNQGDLLESFFSRELVGTTNRYLLLKQGTMFQAYDRSTSSLQSFPAASAISASNQAVATQSGSSQVQVVASNGTKSVFLEPNLVNFGLSNELVWLQSSVLNQAKFYSLKGNPAFQESYVDEVILSNPNPDTTWIKF